MDERICIFEDVYNDASARAQAEREKSGAFGMLARMKLWDRPKEAEITLAHAEKRYEPFWMARAARRTCYTASSRSPRDALFDLGADFAGLVVPGGTIVVKLIDKLSKKA